MTALGRDSPWGRGREGLLPWLWARVHVPPSVFPDKPAGPCESQFADL